MAGESSDAFADNRRPAVKLRKAMSDETNVLSAFLRLPYMPVPRWPRTPQPQFTALYKPGAERGAGR